MEWLRRNRELLWMGLFGVVVLSYFVSEYMGLTYHPVWIPADDAVPFLPVFVIPYVAWYVYVPGMMLLAYRCDRAAYRRMVLGIFGGFALCYAGFLLWPTCVAFRPDAEGEGFLLWLCRLIYAADRPVNVFPSVHCFEAVTVHLLLFTFGEWGRRRRLLRVGSLLVCILCCASTVFIKQHSLADLIAGCALGALIALGLHLVSRQRQRRLTKKEG